MNNAPPLTKEQWIERCAAHIRKQCGDPDTSLMEAEAWIEQNPSDIQDSPELVADDIMSYWEE